MSAALSLNHYARCAHVNCFDPAVMYAAGGVPLCLVHAHDVCKALRLLLPGHPRPGRRRRSAARADDPGRPEASTSIVYYGLVGDHVKIGRTASPSRRWRRLLVEYGELTILVVEPGTSAVERARHAEFDQLRVRQTELFRYEDGLREHIAELQRLRPNWTDLVRTAHASWRAVSPITRRGGLVIPGVAGGELTSE